MNKHKRVALVITQPQVRILLITLELIFPSDLVPAYDISNIDQIKVEEDIEDPSERISNLLRVASM